MGLSDKKYRFKQLLYTLETIFLRIRYITSFYIVSKRFDNYSLKFPPSGKNFTFLQITQNFNSQSECQLRPFSVTRQYTSPAETNFEQEK